MNASQFEIKFNLSKIVIDELSPLAEALEPGAGDKMRQMVDGDINLSIKAGLPLATFQKLLPVVQKYVTVVKELSEGSAALANMVDRLDVSPSDFEYVIGVEGLSAPAPVEEDEAEVAAA